MTSHLNSSAIKSVKRKDEKNKNKRAGEKKI